MKKKFSHIFTLGMGIVLGSTMFSNAAATFQSSGKIQYTDQTTGNTVVFDAEDFNTIENNITTGKNGILQSLQDIKTYLDADGNVVQYEQPDTSYTGTPGFDKLAEAVSKSQEVPALEDRTVTDKEGNPLYFASEEAKNSRDIMNSTTRDPGFEGAEIKGYTPATADNLTAGTAAWVDGELVLGNGFDNTTYKNYIPLVFANFMSGGNGPAHLIFDVENLSKITLVTRVGTTNPTTFWGSNQDLPTITITTKTGETMEVMEGVSNPTAAGAVKLPMTSTGSYVYDLQEFDVSSYKYFHIYHANKDYRDWIHFVKCE